MTLFEYVILFTGEKRTSRKDEEAPGWKRKPKLLSFERLLAKDEKEVGILAARAIPSEYEEDLDRITIAVRPF
jgi:hypothetical protein